MHLSKETKAFCGVTLGERGFTGIDNGEVFDIPAVIVETVDTLGAGDVFHGAFMVGILHGWDTRQSARFASAAAAMTCRELGGRKGIPTFDEVLEFMDR